MRGVRFYLEYPDGKEKSRATRKDLGNHSGNVLAVFYDQWQPAQMSIHYEPGRVYDGVSAIFYERDSDVSFGSIHQNYLSERCKRISESMAREIHPRLFTYLEYDPS